MKVQQLHMRGANDDAAIAALSQMNPNLVLAFGSSGKLSDAAAISKLAAHFPGAVVVGCSTAGEITNRGVFDDSIVLTAVNMEKGKTCTATSSLSEAGSSYAAGQKLGEQLKSASGLKVVLLFSPGLNVNGSELIGGVRSVLGDQIPVTGGLAGDGARFQQTYVMLGQQASQDTVVAVGLTGDVKVGYGSRGGWEPFGPDRLVTKVDKNVLYEVDGRRALDLYKEYLGDKAAELPASGLLYPFAIIDKANSHDVIRTILNVDEAAGSLTFAGDIPEGATVRLMHASTDGLAGGAKQAATDSNGESEAQSDGFALLVSCVGRKLVMGDDVDEEVSAVQNVLGPKTTVTGFYSYGEICPFAGDKASKLHNQTMTITYLTE